MKKNFLFLMFIILIVVTSSAQNDMWSQFDKLLTDMENNVNNLFKEKEELTLLNDQQKEQLSVLQDQFNNALNLLTDYSTKLTIYENKLASQAKMLAKLWWVLIIWTALKLVRIILGFIPQTRIINKVIPWYIDVII